MTLSYHFMTPFPSRSVWRQPSWPGSCQPLWAALSSFSWLGLGTVRSHGEMIHLHIWFINTHTHIYIYIIYLFICPRTSWKWTRREESNWRDPLRRLGARFNRFNRFNLRAEPDMFPSARQWRVLRLKWSLSWVTSQRQRQVGKSSGNYLKIWNEISQITKKHKTQLSQVSPTRPWRTMM